MKKYLTLIALITIILCSACSSKKDKSNGQTYRLPDSISMIQANGIVKPKSGILDLSSETSGTVERIVAQSGAFLHKGDTIMILDPIKARLSLKQAQSKLRSQEAAIESARAALKKSEIEQEQASKELSTTERLYAKGAETQSTLEHDKVTLQLKTTQREQAEEQLRMAQQSLSELHDAVNIARQNLEECIITAPQDGQLLDIMVERGRTVKPYDLLATYATKEPTIIEAEVDELFANSVKKGQPVAIQLIGYPETIATGKVDYVASFLSSKSIFSGANNERQDRQMRKIKILPDTQNNLPLIGTKVTCQINIK